MDYLSENILRLLNDLLHKGQDIHYPYTYSMPALDLAFLPASCYELLEIIMIMKFFLELTVILDRPLMVSVKKWESILHTFCCQYDEHHLKGKTKRKLSRYIQNKCFINHDHVETTNPFPE